MLKKEGPIIISYIPFGTFLWGQNILFGEGNKKSTFKALPTNEYTPFKNLKKLEIALNELKKNHKNLFKAQMELLIAESRDELKKLDLTKLFIIHINYRNEQNNDWNIFGAKNPNDFNTSLSNKIKINGIRPIRTYTDKPILKQAEYIGSEIQRQSDGIIRSCSRICNFSIKYF